MNKKYENEKRYGLEITWDPNNYDPILHGDVEVIRIFYSENCLKDILAELRFCFGGTTIIEWTNPDEREKFEEGINGYTLFLDERVVVDNYKAGELLSDENISDYGKMRLEETEGILKAQLKRKEYQVNQLNDEHNNAVKIYKDYQDQLLATNGPIDHNLAVLMENASNHAISIHQRLKAAEEEYDNMMKELIIIQEKLSSAKKNKEENY